MSLTLIKGIYSVSTLILWACILVNWLMIWRNHQLSKKYGESIEAADRAKRDFLTAINKIGRMQEDSNG